MRIVGRGLLGIATLTSIIVPGSATPVSAVTAVDNLACAQSIVATWPLTQLANETIVVPVNAMNIGSMGPEARAGFGGLLLLGATAPATLSTVLAKLQSLTPEKYSMMVMTDEEGGGVERLTNVVGTFPWAQTMGKNLTPAQITAIGLRVGTALNAEGVNTDLAPVLDVDGRAQYPGEVNPDGYRSFSGAAALAAADGTAFMTGLAQANETSVVKHFPGLGGSTRNTDFGPARTLAWSVLQKSGLIPFERAISRGAAAIMLSNASVPGLTPLPSSISPAVVSELRNVLGFQGLIVTDSLSSGALSALHLSVSAAAVKALEAGADQVLYGPAAAPAPTLAAANLVASAIVNAVNAGTLSRATLSAAAAQVLAARNTLSCPAVPVS
jgi:beta-N-acetylhexosaminidase